MCVGGAVSHVARWLQSQGHPALRQVALDMMRRLKQYSPMVEALIGVGEVRRRRVRVSMHVLGSQRVCVSDAGCYA